MAENLIINGVTYNDVESVAIANEENETVQYYSDAIRYSEQSLTDEQKVQTRTNIDVYSKDEIDTRIPEATSLNNGQFLRVVDGVATWSIITNAEEVSF